MAGDSHFEKRLQELASGRRYRAAGHFVHGARTAHPDYNCWRKMRSRCNDPSNPDYKYYGGRGLRVSERWASFAAFLLDMGPRPTPKHTIDRIDNDGHYEPGNCRWATMAQQNANRRR